MSSRTKEDRLLTLSQAGKRLGTGERFARRLVAEKRIPYVKLGAGRRSPVRIRESELERYIRDCTIDPSD